MFPNFIARILFSSRWLLMPFYVALVVELLSLLYKCAMQVYELILQITSYSEEQTILSVLSIVDLTLTASLVVMVIFSGFANFIARIDIEDNPVWPHWLVGIDFGELKLKLMGSITAIAAIKLLESYMNVAHVSDRDMLFQAGLFALFVLAALILAVAERVGTHNRVVRH